ncbi:MAG: hypothetical protein JNL01_04190 [Bdellovibrionales bacterium]|nr:hypothetical protein [Bdellovibrionales bacterium]
MKSMRAQENWIAGIFLFLGSFGSIGLWMPSFLNEKLSWMTVEAGISPLPHVYTGNGKTEYYRNRFEIQLGQQSWRLTSKSIRDRGLSGLRLRAWVYAPLAFSLGSENPGQMQKWAQTTCQLLSQPEPDLKLGAWDQATGQLLRSWGFQCP